MLNFDEIYGQKKAINELQKIIENKRLTHFYIFSGAKGIGKMTLANAFAKTLECKEEGVLPCMKCPSCISFDSKNNPDIVYLKKSKTKISVDDIREQIIRDEKIKPFSNRYKIYIVENAEEMTISAQNSFLKTLEEPSSFNIFILTVNDSKNLLETIRSRAIEIKLKALLDEEIDSYCVDNALNIKNSILKAYSAGNIGKIKMIVEDEKYNEILESIKNLQKKLINDDLFAIIEESKNIEKFKDNIEDYLNLLIYYYRDLLLFQTLDDYYQKDNLEEYKLISSKINTDSIFKIIDEILNTKKLLSENSNFKLSLDVLLLKMKENIHA